MRPGFDLKDTHLLYRLLPYGTPNIYNNLQLKQPGQSEILIREKKVGT